MQFLTAAECQAWLTERKLALPDRAVAGDYKRIGFPSEPYRLRYFARVIADDAMNREPALLWITEWGIWPSSENWHLYDRLRRSYGDARPLDTAPGHLFQGNETEDLATFLQVALLNGWGGYVMTPLNDVTVRFSHDEYFDFFARQAGGLNDIRAALMPK